MVDRNRTWFTAWTRIDRLHRSDDDEEEVLEHGHLLDSVTVAVTEDQCGSMESSTEYRIPTSTAKDKVSQWTRG